MGTLFAKIEIPVDSVLGLFCFAKLELNINFKESYVTKTLSGEWNCHESKSGQKGFNEVFS